MYIKSIETYGFRNLEKLEFNPNSNINIFIGKNGQGKTNLLETIYVASKGKSFRPGKIQEWRNQSLDPSQPCRLKFNLVDENRTHKLKILWDENSKQITLDDKKVTSGKVLQLFPTILFSPESLLSVKEGPDKRRNLIDEMLTSSVATQHFYNQYRKSLKTRNKFLKTSKETGTFNETLFKSLNVLFLNFSTQLTMARIELLFKLSPHIKKALSLIFSDELGFEFEYIISEREVKSWSASDLLEFQQSRSFDLKNAELSYGSSLVGAHKHDLKFTLNEKDARFFSSQGQQRGLILAIKMAEVMYRFEQGEKPVLLLDDVLSELDIEKREKLIEFLSTFETQIFITTTDKIDGVEMKGGYFNINQGHVELNTLLSL